MANNKKNEAITARDVDFAKWYTDVCRKAELMDYSGGLLFIALMDMLYGNKFKIIWIKNLKKQDMKMFICRC